MLKRFHPHCDRSSTSQIRLPQVVTRVVASSAPLLPQLAVSDVRQLIQPSPDSDLQPLLTTNEAVISLGCGRARAIQPSMNTPRSGLAFVTMCLRPPLSLQQGLVPGGGYCYGHLESG